MSASKALVSLASSSARRQTASLAIRQYSTSQVVASSPSTTITTTTHQVMGVVALRPPSVAVGGRGGGGRSTSNFSSSSSSSAKTPHSDQFPEPTSSATTADPTMKNVVMALGLMGFVASVFTYSMNAVGRGDEVITLGSSESSSDPLAALRAEAQEARQMEKHQYHGKLKMSKEEIDALETGRSNVDDDAQAMADALEAEASRAVYGNSNNSSNNKTTTTTAEPKKKKSWWRFGF
jgi:hypothetical protein